MQWTQEHEGIHRNVTKLIEAEINPHVDTWEEAGIFPACFSTSSAISHQQADRVCRHGPRLLLPAGVHRGARQHSLRRRVPMAMGVQTDMATPALARFGADELCREFLPPSIAGDYVACLGVSEVGAGSDVASIETTARKVGGDYAINGGKMWTTNGIQADWMCLLADTGDGPVHRNKSLICVPMRAKAGGLHERNQHQPGLWRCAPWLDRRGRR